MFSMSYEDKVTVEFCKQSRILKGQNVNEMLQQK